MSDIDEKPADDLKDQDLQNRLATFDRALHARQDAEHQKTFPGSRNLDAASIRASRIGIELMVAILAGVALGYGLDQQFGTSPLFILLGSLFGFAGGVLNAWRAMNGKYGQVGYRDETQAGNTKEQG